jgi:hypothetical protein
MNIAVEIMDRAQVNLSPLDTDLAAEEGGSSTVDPKRAWLAHNRERARLSLGCASRLVADYCDNLQGKFGPW